MSKPSSTRLPSDFTHHEMHVSHKAFPRCRILQEHCKLKRPLTVTCNVFCSTVTKVNKYKFMVEKGAEEGDKVEQGGYFLRRTQPSPAVDVCILQCNSKNSLTAKDIQLLQYFKERYFPEHAEKVVFVIDENLNDKQFCSISEAISGILEWEEDFNDTLQRLFPRQSDDLAVRISLLLEKQLIAKNRSIAGDEFKKGNETDLLYHQLKCVSIRNGMIREIGHEDNQLYVAIDNIVKKVQIRNFLKKYIQNEDKIDIRPYRKLVMTELSLKSGDTVASTSNTRIGTVGLGLRNGTHQYSATCKHVVDNCLRDISDFGIEVNSENIVIRNRFHQQFRTVSVYSPSVAFDFSVIKLGENISISTGIRNQSDVLVSGNILHRDSITLPQDYLVYKWGTSSRLTVGRYKGRREEVPGHPKFIIQSTGSSPFAVEGDSGSLICFNKDKSETAAFVLCGYDKLRGEYICLSLIDALKSCEQQLPHINTYLNT